MNTYTYETIAQFVIDNKNLLTKNAQETLEYSFNAISEYRKIAKKMGLDTSWKMKDYIYTLAQALPSKYAKVVVEPKVKPTINTTKTSFKGFKAERYNDICKDLGKDVVVATIPRDEFIDMFKRFPNNFRVKNVKALIVDGEFNTVIQGSIKNNYEQFCNLIK